MSRGEEKRRCHEWKGMRTTSMDAGCAEKLRSGKLLRGKWFHTGCAETCVAWSASRGISGRWARSVTIAVTTAAEGSPHRALYLLFFSYQNFLYLSCVHTIFSYHTFSLSSLKCFLSWVIVSSQYILGVQKSSELRFDTTEITI